MCITSELFWCLFCEEELLSYLPADTTIPQNAEASWSFPRQSVILKLIQCSTASGYAVLAPTGSRAVAVSFSKLYLQVQQSAGTAAQQRECRHLGLCALCFMISVSTSEVLSPVFTCLPTSEHISGLHFSNILCLQQWWCSQMASLSPDLLCVLCNGSVGRAPVYLILLGNKTLVPHRSLRKPIFSKDG